MQGSIRIATLFGIEVRIHTSWLLIAVLVFVTFADTLAELPLVRAERWGAAAAMTFLFFCSVLLHELSHSLVARRFRLPVHSITLFVFGGVSNLRREPDTARSEFLMAIAGPGMSFVLAGVFLGLSAAIDLTVAGILGLALMNIFALLAQINLWLGLFNLLPGFPLDGGRVLRSIVWGIRRDRRAATRVATRGGQAVAVLLALGGLYRIAFQQDFVFGTWSILIAFFLFSAAQASYRQEVFDESLRDVTVGALMSRELSSVASHLTLDAFVSYYALPARGRSFTVQEPGGDVVGVVSLGDARRVPRAEWSTRRVADVMTRFDRVQPLRSTDDARAGLERLFRQDVAELPVVDDGATVGIFERDAVLEYLRMREELGFRPR